jgi:hypothetical protein
MKLRRTKDLRPGDVILCSCNKKCLGISSVISIYENSYLKYYKCHILQGCRENRDYSGSKCFVPGRAIIELIDHNLDDNEDS